MFDWIESAGTKTWLGVATVFAGICFLIASLGVLGMIGIVLLVGGAILWTMGGDQELAELKARDDRVKPWDRKYGKID